METLYGRLVPTAYAKSTDEYKQATSLADKNQVSDDCYKKLLALIYLKGANPRKTGELLEDMANDYAMKHDKYPKTLDEAIELVGNYKPQKSMPGKGKDRKSHDKNGKDMEDNEEGTETQSSFGQDGTRRHNPNIVCHRCGKKGHIAAKCTEPTPKSGDNETSNAQQDTEPRGQTRINLHNYGVLMHEKERGRMNL